MICRICSYFPCAREECDLYNEKCEYGISIVENISKEMERDNNG